MLRSVLRGMYSFVFLGLISIGTLHADDIRLKPFILGNTPAGDMAKVVETITAALKAQGFDEAGRYSPYAGATVIVVTNMELKLAASRAKNGGFGAGERISVTDVKGKLQVSYVNPAYVAAAYGLGRLDITTAKLKSALGATIEFGADQGLTAEQLAPGIYHYMVGMPYFRQVDVLAKYPDYQTAVAAVEKGLATGKGGTTKVYRIDLPGRQASVFGVGVVTGDGVDTGDKDTDTEVMHIIDYRDQRSTAFLPYEILVQGFEEGYEVIALRGRYRIALYFPDTRMAGAHGFTKIMSSPGGIKTALTAVAEAGMH
jgi:hypothetical protein